MIPSDDRFRSGDVAVTSARDPSTKVKDFLWSGLRFLIDGLSTAAILVGVFFIFLIASYFAVLPVQAAENWPSWAVIAVLPVFVAALGYFLYQFFGEHRRRQLFLGFAQRGVLGWLGPVLVGIVAFLFAASVFAVVTMLLLDAGLVQLSAPGCAKCQPDIGDVLTFYIWDFLAAIPLLNVNESLHWDVPLVYSGALMGWLVLAFKVAVIIPLIQAVRTYLQVRKETPRIHLRPWAWRRATRVGGAVRISWASAPPPDGYVYDINVEGPETKETWLTATTQTSDTYARLGREGLYGFSVTCREEESNAVGLTSFPMKVLVRPDHPLAKQAVTRR